jgi:hypothetical protein
MLKVDDWYKLIDVNLILKNKNFKKSEVDKVIENIIYELKTLNINIKNIIII